MDRRAMLTPIRFVMTFALSGVVIAQTLAASGAAASSVNPASGDPKAASEKAAPALSLASVQWSGPAVSLDSLKRKTTIVMPFVTWCPKCNVWAPEMIEQVR